MSFERVASTDDLWPGEMRGVIVGGLGVVVLNINGQIRAYADQCAHRNVRLSTGQFAGGVLLCTAHYWEYDPDTGRGINPEGVCLRSFPVKVENGDIWVDVEDQPGSDDASRRTA